MPAFRKFGFGALFAVLALAAGSAVPPPAAAQSVQDQLPDMGTAAQATLSLEDEYRIGRMVMRGLRDSGRVLEDPEVGEYLQSLGLRLSSLAQEGNRNFNFFVVRDPAINAFALPGGFIGVHSGLLLETDNESELAAVLAHEVAHVTQRHIARGLENQSRANLVSTAATLAAILIGAMAGGGGDATMGAISAAQNMAVQSQINFTRENEYEADRVGIGILASAGYDPNAMAGFFETMGRRTQLGPDQVPELLRTHPVTSARIAEARGRAAQIPAGEPRESLSYALMRERVRVLSTPSSRDPREYYVAVAGNEPDASLAQVYGRALAQIQSGEPAAAIPTLVRLRQQYPEILPFHTALGQAQLASGETRAALDTLERAHELAPRNVPVTVRYGEALLQAGRPKRAHEVLLDLFNAVPPTQEQIRLTAIAANAAGDVADAYSYMAEYHLMGGDLPLAINQLELALSVPNISSVQRSKFTARLKEIREWLPKERTRSERPTGGSQRPAPGG
ncbi:MAG: M48 family peptidase [Lysobacterales bacterium]|jgi:predicted Zn-dependent protease|nr:MAG: M48 family peptidase [Xanthomonadales bacterium]